MNYEINKKYFYLFKIIAFTYVLLLLFTYNNNKSYANASFIDLFFKVGSIEYTSQNESKTLDLAPFVYYGTSLVPFRAILEELGYSVQWDNKTKTISALNENNTIILRINSIYAEVNGEDRILSVAPKIVSGRTVVPLRFVAECSGASVSWDQDNKTIHITQYGKFDTGKVVYYEKTNSKNTIYAYDGDKISTITLENKDIQNWYTYKGQVFLTVSEESRESKGLYLLKDNDLQLLLENFEMKDSFEYNDNLVILGYDRVKQYDMLCRFDGKAFYIVKDNFFVGKRFIFKDKLVISKYDNNRKYAVVVIDKTSWEPIVLRDAFIINNYIVDKNYVYITGNGQEGTKNFIVVYDGNSISASSFKVVMENASVNVDINNIVMFEGKLFINIDGILYVVENNNPMRVVFQDIGAKVQYTVKFMKVFKNKLYVGVTFNTSYYDDDYSSISKPNFMIENKGGVIEVLNNLETSDLAVVKANKYVTVNLGKYRKFIQKLEPVEMKVEGNNLLVWGQDSDSLDQVLYTYNGATINKMLDIVRVNNTLSFGDNTFIDVRDRDRLSATLRNTIIMQKGSAISNLIVGFETEKWADLDGSLIFTGYQSSGQRNKVYSFKSELLEQLGNYDVDYWQKLDDSLFIGGLNKESRSYQLYKFKDGNKSFLKDNIIINTIIKVKNPYYIIDAFDKNSDSSSPSSRVLLIYDDELGEFYKMKSGVQVWDMLYVQ
ncbi:MAG TPA: copper amine oxidase N-terminal domain-containing protein [Pseudobacteroides sp.]|uniref:copper amine oxidase N-terminal domain-containing protein n=1 Tax=Pseudobacteroides sp. TaxID=1968840 RepID=UPI002F92CC19